MWHYFQHGVQLVYDVSGVNGRTIVATISGLITIGIGIVGIYYANKIAKEQIRLAQTQKVYSEWAFQVDAMRFSVESIRDDLNRGMNQYSGVLSNHDKIESSENILKQMDAMLKIAKNGLKKAIDEYEEVLEKNPMKYKIQEGMKPMASDGYTLEELKKIASQTS